MSFMSLLFKDRRLSLIKKKLILLYLLNVTDIIFTLLLISTGMFMEANFVMEPIITNNPLLGLGIKIVIPFVLFVWVFYRMKNASDKQLYHSNIIINICLIFYGLINLSHVIWCILSSII